MSQCHAWTKTRCSKDRALPAACLPSCLWCPPAANKLVCLLRGFWMARPQPYGTIFKHEQSIGHKKWCYCLDQVQTKLVSTWTKAVWHGRIFVLKFNTILNNKPKMVKATCGFVISAQLWWSSSFLNINYGEHLRQYYIQNKNRSVSPLENTRKIILSL